MKLSEAIRKGIEHYPKQAFKTYKKGNSACALGCANYGAFNFEFKSSVALVEAYPVLHEKIHPEGFTYTKLDLYMTIVHLNDISQWTREQIADWLESIGL